MRHELVDATVEHAIYVAENLRDMDRFELLACGVVPEEALVLSWEKSMTAWTWLVDGVPAAIGGVASASLMDTTGNIWLLTTPLVEQYPIAFTKVSRIALARVKEMYPTVENFVSAEYESCLRWLEWLGFKIGHSIYMGEAQEEFRHVESH